MADNVGTPIKDSPHLLNIHRTGKNALDGIDVTQPTVMMVDQVNPVALYWLLDQFDMIRHGWDIGASSDDAKREVVKMALKLHAKAGTVWAVREICRLAGQTEVIILEGSAIDQPFIINDTMLVGGSRVIGDSHHWAEYEIVVVTSTTALTEDLATVLTNVLNNFAAPARCHFVGFTSQVTMTEAVTLGEAPTIIEI